jgi:PilZ domain
MKLKGQNLTSSRGLNRPIRLHMAALARYHARQPRYVLNATDNNLIRYSGAERFTWEEKTVIKNISLTGLSFIAPIDLKPQLGEVVRIEFDVPSAEHMACHAIVTRIEHLNSVECEVALHFYKMERLQRINLVQGLTIKNTMNQAEADLNQIKKAQKSFQMISLLSSGFLWIIAIKLYFDFYQLFMI